jgi:hypothetical protein
VEKKTTLDEMGNERHTLCDGLVIETKPNLGTIRKMERYWKLPFLKFREIDFNFIDNVVPFILFLAQQVKPEITEAEVEKLLEGCDQQKLDKALASAFNVTSKKKK